MASVAVCAGATEPRPPVLDVHLLVALVALQNGFFEWFVGVVTRFARHRCMGREPRVAFRFERPMAAGAVPPSKELGLRFEDMAVVTVHRHAIEIDVHERGLFIVALRADSDIRSVEGGFVGVVAFVALHLLVGQVS